MRVLVTGATGCIGTWVMKQLLEQGHEVVVYDAAPDPWRLRMLLPESEVAKLKLITGGIEDTAKVKAVIKDEGVTHVCHLAAVLMPYCQQNPVSGGLINVVGTLNVFEGARDSGRDVRVVYASSSAVWGPEEAYEDRPLTEADPLIPATHYGVFKHANEGNARVFFSTNDISSVGLRPWAVYGFGRDTGLTADPSLALKHVALGKPYHIRLSNQMDMQYVEDTAAIFLGCLFSEKKGAHAFNIQGDLIRMEDFGAAVEKERSGASALITAGGVTVTVAKRMDDTALQQYLGVKPATPLNEGIRKSLAIFDRLIAQGVLS
jgi:nucleoside-diphosphate-sugar epimerase